jgi:hypothetical protein
MHVEKRNKRLIIFNEFVNLAMPEACSAADLVWEKTKIQVQVLSSDHCMVGKSLIRVSSPFQRHNTIQRDDVLLLEASLHDDKW